MDNAQHNNADELLRYLDKEMNATEQIAFETELLSNEQLRAELDSLQSARQAVILFGIKQQVSKIHKEEIENLKQAKVIKMPVYRNLVKYGIAAAACIALVFFGINQYNSSKLSADKLFAEQYSRFEPSNDRGETVTITAIENAYLNKNYHQVVKLYISLARPEPKDMLMAGIACLETSQNLLAVETFQSLLETNKINGFTSYNDEGSYYLALAYLKNKNYQPAIDLMQQIRGDNDNKYTNKFPAEFIDRVKKLASK